MTTTLNVRYLNTSTYSYKVEYTNNMGVDTTGVNVSPIVALQGTTVFFTPVSGSVSGLPVALETVAGVVCQYVTVSVFPAKQANASTFSLALEAVASDSLTCSAAVNPFSGTSYWWIWIAAFVVLILLILLIVFGVNRYNTYYAPVPQA